MIRISEKDGRAFERQMKRRAQHCKKATTIEFPDVVLDKPTIEIIRRENGTVIEKYRRLKQ